jgi:regulator of protease activity HflC (stomatin/prohibitin superfamily)
VDKPVYCFDEFRRQIECAAASSSSQSWAAMALEWAPFVLLWLFVLATLWQSFFTVEQQEMGIVQRLGKFVRVASPGLNLKLPWLERVDGYEDLRVQQLAVKVETKTEDNVFVTVTVAVQHYVLPGKVYEAFYKLDDSGKQIAAYVFDVVRAKVPKLKLDATSVTRRRRTRSCCLILPARSRTSRLRCETP